MSGNPRSGSAAAPVARWQIRCRLCFESASDGARLLIWAICAPLSTNHPHDSRQKWRQCVVSSALDSHHPRGVAFGSYWGFPIPARNVTSGRGHAAFPQKPRCHSSRLVKQTPTEKVRKSAIRECTKDACKYAKYVSMMNCDVAMLGFIRWRSHILPQNTFQPLPISAENCQLTGCALLKCRTFVFQRLRPFFVGNP